MSDLAADDNELSVWWISDDRGNLKEIITGLSKDRPSKQPFDFAILDEAFLRKIGVRFKKTKGGTTIEKLNANYHHDLQYLNVKQIKEVALEFARLAQSQRQEDEKAEELRKAKSASKLSNEEKAKAAMQKRIGRITGSIVRQWVNELEQQPKGPQA